MPYEMYRDDSAKREWRWRYKIRSDIIGVSSEGYTHKRGCERSIEIMKESTEAEVIEVED